MSICVEVFTADSHGQKTYRPNQKGHDLAGPEVWRTQVYGSAYVQNLGLTLLPTLVDGDIHATGANLERLVAEVATLIDNVECLAQETSNVPEQLRARLLNISDAAQNAQNNAGGVSIW